jgi:hypothetical protein
VRSAQLELPVPIESRAFPRCGSYYLGTLVLLLARALHGGPGHLSDPGRTGTLYWLRFRDQRTQWVSRNTGQPARSAARIVDEATLSEWP